MSNGTKTAPVFSAQLKKPLLFSQVSGFFLCALLISWEGEDILFFLGKLAKVFEAHFSLFA